MHVKCMLKMCNSPLLLLDMMLSSLIRLQLLIPPLHLIQKLNALTSTSSQPATTMAHIGNPVFMATQSPSSSWVIDSGASSHMSSVNSLFHNHCPIKYNFILADGSTRPVLRKGIIHSTIDCIYLIRYMCLSFLSICYL